MVLYHFSEGIIVFWKCGIKASFRIGLYQGSVYVLAVLYGLQSCECFHRRRIISSTLCHNRHRLPFSVLTFGYLVLVFAKTKQCIVTDFPMINITGDNIQCGFGQERSGQRSQFITNTLHMVSVVSILLSVLYHVFIVPCMLIVHLSSKTDLLCSHFLRRENIFLDEFVMPGNI